MRHLIKQLEDVTGQPLDDQQLVEALNLYRKIRESQQDLYRRVAAQGCGLSWREVSEVVHAGYLLDRTEYLSLLLELLNELPDVAPDRNLPQSIRLLLAGSAIAPGDAKLVDIIQSTGAEIVGDLLWSGYASIADLDLKDNSLQGLIEAYLDRFPHAGLPQMEIDSDRKLTYLKGLIQKRRPME